MSAGESALGHNVPITIWYPPINLWSLGHRKTSGDAIYDEAEFNEMALPFLLDDMKFEVSHERNIHNNAGLLPYSKDE